MAHETDYCADCEFVGDRQNICIGDGCRKNKQVEVCEGCGEGTLWDDVPTENIIEEGNGPLEHFGFPCEEMIVVGYVCPLCGHRNDF